MTRTRATAKQAGASFERLVANYLAENLGDDGIDRQVKTGAKDLGDIRGVKTFGRKLVIEAKDYGGKLHPTTWIREAQVEAGNADAAAGIVVAKRLGTRDPGEQWCLLTLRDLVVLLGGEA
jgi:hypothetical protein